MPKIKKYNKLQKQTTERAHLMMDLSPTPLAVA